MAEPISVLLQGANYYKVARYYDPTLTSYDYDAIYFQRHGWANTKIPGRSGVDKTVCKSTVPEIPAKIPVITLPAISVK